MTRRLTSRSTAVAATALLGLGLLGTATPAVAGSTATADPTAVLTGRCLDADVGLTLEESRLDNRLPRNQDPTRLQGTPFATQMIEGAGFQDLGPSLVRELCGTRSLAQAQRLVERRGERLWQRAVERAQTTEGRVAGELPYSDDRPLYWARLQATAALRQWDARFDLSVVEQDELITSFDKASRGMLDIEFPAGPDLKRVLISGFDPYTLDGGETGPAEGSVGNNIRHGNPSGAVALSMDGTTFRAENGTRQMVQAYTLPVNYTEFEAGYLEDTVGPWMTAGARALTASLTVSQAGGSQFNLEQWNARYHGVSPGNDGSQPCPRVDGVPQLAIHNPGCNTEIPRRWGGSRDLDLFDPPQWTSASLPIEAMIEADTGRDVPRPPGDTWPDQEVAFGVVWNTRFTEFPDCTSPQLVTRNSTPPVTYPPADAPVPPSEGSCSYSGGGGNYLSNESAYRNTLLRDRLGVDIPAGHIHTPGMQNFRQDNVFGVSDPVFDAWRLAIVAQTQNLVHAVGAVS